MPVRQLSYDLTPVAELALAGPTIGAMLPLLSRIETASPTKGGMANVEIVPTVYFSDLGRPKQSDRGRCFSVIVGGLGDTQVLG